MADNKKSFVLYADLIHTVNALSDEEAGKLFKHVLAYVNDKNPATPDKITQIAFEPIKQQLKRDLKHWEQVKEKRAAAGKASAEARKHNEQKSTNVDTPKQTVTHSTVIDTDNGNVTVTGNVINKENTGPLANSNLFRQPRIPTLDQVKEVFMRSGGTDEMAQSFFQKYEATGWYLNNSPIVSFNSLATKFIQNWKTNTHGNSNQRIDAARPGHQRAPL
jgi:hypothetical protein